MLPKILCVTKNNLFKYGLRFLILQFTISFTTLWYFDKFLIGDYKYGYEIIINNLYEDQSRFYEFIPKEFVKIDIYLAIFVFIFLIILYSSKFYSYVNELSFTVNKSIIDEFIPIYLLWTATFLSFLQIFRFTAVSRLYLILFTFLVPLILVFFRNSEVVSSILGRNPSKEKYLMFNLPIDSVYRELRILKLRNCIGEHQINNLSEVLEIIKEVNLKSPINLIVINLEKIKKLDYETERSLLDTNKKILLLTYPNFEFNLKFIFRSSKIGNKKIIYINNDIQYGSQYILKRFIDLLITFLISPIIFSIFIVSYLYVLLTSGYPVVIKQNRVGLHGSVFSMYKLRTMNKNSHLERKNLSELNLHSGPLFKIDNDPRLIKGAKFLRKFSIDEIPQFLNVINGSMSIVGPRPLFPEDNKYFDQKYLRRLNVIPGITGLLQINERNTPDFDIWFKYDLEYIENWSLVRDLEIILKTPISLFKVKNKGK